MSLSVTGSETHQSTSKCNAAGISGINTAGLEPGELAFNQETKQFYYFDPDSVAVVDNVDVVDTFNSCGRWVRACVNCNGPTGATGASGT